MKYLEAQPDYYERISDPFIEGITARICFKSRNNYFSAKALKSILEDKTFLFIHDNVAYFQAQ